MRNKKGLSDVVATVLIILLVVAAVSAIWLFIQPTLKGAGKGIQKGAICLTNTIEPVSCDRFDAGQYLVSYKRTTDEGIININSIKINIETEEGAAVSGNGNFTIQNGASMSSEVSSTTDYSAKQVSISAVFDLGDEQTQTCTSITIPCTNSLRGV